jgi:hypothetical protein
MPSATPTTPFQPAAFASGDFSRTGATDDGFRGIRWLIWTYFWLLILEGPLRKWIVPGLSNPLLVARDPVLMVCYFLALRNGAFPRTVFLPLIAGVGAIAFALSVIGMAIGAQRSSVVVLLYGLRASFGHLPLIFVIARVFSRRDVERVGKWLLMMAVPMVILVYFQYKAGPDARINVGAGGVEASQIGVAVTDVEKIRPPAIFSFNTGLTAYLALVAGYLLAHFLSGGKIYRRWSGILASVALIASVPLAVSRSTVGALSIIGMAAGICVITRPELFKRALTITILGGLAIAIAGSFAFFREGIVILGMRFEEASGIKVGIVERFIEGFTGPLEKLSSTPFLGAGLGVGTNVGSKLLSGRVGFLLSEGEWGRAVDEMGPLVGVLYILLRVGLVAYMFRVAWKSLKGGSPLSLLLFSACGLWILHGNFSQPTSLGFAVFSGGLCLAAAKGEEIERLQQPPSSPEPVTILKVRGRSVYAEQLHGTSHTA